MSNQVRIITGVVTPDTTQVDTTARFEVGTQLTAADGGEVMYVIAQSAIAQYDAVAILNSSSAIGATICASPLTTTFAADGCGVGFAQVAIAAGSYGWVYTAGYNLRCNVLIACQPKVPLFTTATGGSLDDTIVSAGYVRGVMAKTSAASASAVQIIAFNPSLGVTGFS
jgi:hypothetical protein